MDEIQNANGRNKGIVDLLYDRSFRVYLVVGTINTLLYFGLFALCYRIIHLSHLVAVTIAYVLSMLFHFSVNRIFTFKNGLPISTQLLPYLLTSAVNYLLTVAILEASVRIWSAEAGMVIAIAVTTFTGYLMLRAWVFRPA